MKFFNSIILILCLFSVMNNFSQQKQTELYFDEDGKQIDFVEHFNKKTSFLYSSYKILKDSLIINVISESYKLGKLDSIQNKQIRYYLSSREKNMLIKDKTLIISFKDTIFGYEELKARNLKNTKPLKHKCNLNHQHTYRHNANHRLIGLSLDKYKSDRAKFDKNQKKGLKKLKKQQVVPLYYYGFNNGYDYNNTYFKIKKAPNLLRSIFFKHASKVIILRPDGSYFSYSNIPPDNYVFKLLKKDWKHFEKDYKIAKVNLLKTKNGSFKSLERVREHKKFYIENDQPILINAPKGKIPLPRDVIRVSSRAEMKNYMEDKSIHFFCHGGF